MPWFKSDWMRLVQVLILAGFVSVSGFCFSLGRKRLRRALEVSACGLAVTAATCLFMPEERIIFGVLTCIGLCMLLLLPLEKPLGKINPFFGACLFFLLALFTYGVRYGYLGLYTWRLIELPEVLYTVPWLFPLGLRTSSFFSTDYEPLVPWLFLYISGFFTFRIVQTKEKLHRLCEKGVPLLAKIGCYSLWIYLAHQPVLYGILWLLFKII